MLAGAGPRKVLAQSPACCLNSYSTRARSRLVQLSEATDVDSTRASLSLVVGRTRREAAKLFGGDLELFPDDHLRRAARPAGGGRSGLLGISAGEGMVDAVRAALASRDRLPGMQLVVELPLGQHASESLQVALEAAGARVGEVRHYRQRPCLVVTGDEGGSEGSSTTLATVLAAARCPRDPAFGRQLTSATRWELERGPGSRPPARRGARYGHPGGFRGSGGGPQPQGQTGTAEAHREGAAGAHPRVPSRGAGG